VERHSTDYSPPSHKSRLDSRGEKHIMSLLERLGMRQTLRPDWRESIGNRESGFKLYHNPLP